MAKLLGHRQTKEAANRQTETYGHRATSRLYPDPTQRAGICASKNASTNTVPLFRAG